MINISKRGIIIISIIFLVTLSVLILLFPGSKDPEEDLAPLNNTEEIQARESISEKGLGSVNPEERYPILKRAGLPYENDRYAITYRLDDTAPFGFILQVIDKTTDQGISPSIQAEALRYLKERQVQSTVKIEFKNINDAQ